MGLLHLGLSTNQEGPRPVETQLLAPLVCPSCMSFGVTRAGDPCLCEVNLDRYIIHRSMRGWVVTGGNGTYISRGHRAYDFESFTAALSAAAALLIDEVGYRATLDHFTSLIDRIASQDRTVSVRIDPDNWTSVSLVTDEDVTHWELETSGRVVVLDSCAGSGCVRPGPVDGYCPEHLHEWEPDPDAYRD